MIARGWGRIINIASLQSVRAFANSGAVRRIQGRRHAADPRAGRGVVAAGRELRTRSRPGFSRRRSPLPVATDPRKWQANAARTFIGRNGELADLAGTAIYLASRASDYVTGQTIFVDGGFTRGMRIERS